MGQVDSQGPEGSETPPPLPWWDSDGTEVPLESIAIGAATLPSEIEKAHEAGCVVYAPLMQPRDASRDPYLPLPRDGPGVAAWRRRMGTQEAKAIYKERASTAEWVNASIKCRQALQLGVRGLRKVRQVALLAALAHNVSRYIACTAAGVG